MLATPAPALVSAFPITIIAIVTVDGTGVIIITTVAAGRRRLMAMVTLEIVQFTLLATLTTATLTDLRLRLVNAFGMPTGGNDESTSDKSATYRDRSCGDFGARCARFTVYPKS
jgi:hypothetical protein